jgi:hypothetical protein
MKSSGKLPGTEEIIHIIMLFYIILGAILALFSNGMAHDIKFGGAGYLWGNTAMWPFLLGVGTILAALLLPTKKRFAKIALLVFAFIYLVSFIYITIVSFFIYVSPEELANQSALLMFFVFIILFIIFSIYTLARLIVKKDLS